MSQGNQRRRGKPPALRALIAAGILALAGGIVALLVFVILPFIGFMVGTALLLVIGILALALMLVPLVIFFALARGLWRAHRVTRGGARGQRVTREVAAFDKVRLRGRMSVNVSAGGGPSVTIQCEDHLMSQFFVGTEDEVLYVETTDHAAPDHAPLVEISCTELHEFHWSGMGHGNLTGLSAHDIAISSEGVVTIQASGRSERAEIRLEGLVKGVFEEFVCDDVSVRLSGGCTATVHASRRAEVWIDGAGKVTCHGDPCELVKHVSGLGVVRRA